jgi:hypothetical protein
MPARAIACLAASVLAGFPSTPQRMLVNGFDVISPPQETLTQNLNPFRRATLRLRSTPAQGPWLAGRIRYRRPERSGGLRCATVVGGGPLTGKERLSIRRPPKSVNGLHASGLPWCQATGVIRIEASVAEDGEFRGEVAAVRHQKGPARTDVGHSEEAGSTSGPLVADGREQPRAGEDIAGTPPQIAMCSQHQSLRMPVSDGKAGARPDRRRMIASSPWGEGANRAETLVPGVLIGLRNRNPHPAAAESEPGQENHPDENQTLRPHRFSIGVDHPNFNLAPQRLQQARSEADTEAWASVRPLVDMRRSPVLPGDARPAISGYSAP